MTKLEELIAEQRKTNELLRVLIEGRPPSLHRPIEYIPTVEDEIAAVRAQGGSLAEYFIQKARRSNSCKPRNGAPRLTKRNSEPKKIKKPVQKDSYQEHQS